MAPPFHTTLFCGGDQPSDIKEVKKIVSLVKEMASKERSDALVMELELAQARLEFEASLEKYKKLGQSPPDRIAKDKNFSMLNSLLAKNEAVVTALNKVAEHEEIFAVWTPPPDWEQPLSAAPSPPSMMVRRPSHLSRIW